MSRFLLKGGCGDYGNTDNNDDSSTDSNDSPGDLRNGGDALTSEDDDPNNDHRDDGLH